MTHQSGHLRDMKRALGPDWTYIGTTGLGHLRFRHREGAFFVTGSKVGDWRSIRNALADAKKILARSRSGSPSSRAHSGASSG